MVRRFQIEELLTQDSSGVVFRALDTETDLPVVVRRFFPFGANGGGLSGDEQEDYKVAVERLADIRHPAMRSIISGGCDPVDGMPFIATEWVEGTPLQALLGKGPPTPAEATRILTLALEVCDQISQVLGEDAVWVETDLETIIVAGGDGGRGITFWISPLKWLCKNEGPRGLDCLVNLTEEIMGWKGKRVFDHDGEGLGGWLKWLRQAPGETPLFEAWEKLAAVAGTTPVAHARVPLRPSVRADAPAPIRKKHKSSIPFVIGGSLSLAIISLGGWGLIHWNNNRLKANVGSITMEASSEALSTELEPPLSPPPPMEVATIPPPPAVGAKPPASNKAPEKTAPPPKKVTPVKATTPVKAGPPVKAAPPVKTVPSAKPATPAKAATTASPKTETAGKSRIYQIEDSALLLGQLDKVVILEAPLKEVKRSDRGKGKTIYLMFGPAAGGKWVHGGIDVAKGKGDLAESALAGLIGKKLRIEGVVRPEGSGAARFPVVMIDKRSAIQEVP